MAEGKVMDAGMEADRHVQNCTALKGLDEAIDGIENLLAKMGSGPMEVAERPPEEPLNFSTLWPELCKSICSSSQRIRDLTNKIREIIYG